MDKLKIIAYDIYKKYEKINNKLDKKILERVENNKGLAIENQIKDLSEELLAYDIVLGFIIEYLEPKDKEWTDNFRDLIQKLGDI